MNIRVSGTEVNSYSAFENIFHGDRRRIVLVGKGEMRDGRERWRLINFFFLYPRAHPKSGNTSTSRPWSCPPQSPDAHSDEMSLVLSLPDGFMQNRDP